MSGLKNHLCICGLRKLPEGHTGGGLWISRPHSLILTSTQSLEKLVFVLMECSLGKAVRSPSLPVFSEPEALQLPERPKLRCTTRGQGPGRGSPSAQSLSAGMGFLSRASLPAAGISHLCTPLHTLAGVFSSIATPGTEPVALPEVFTEMLSQGAGRWR